jgi:ElaB/YqjD/DUF883 family membrane-anchored ribosome-binding protein
MQEETRTGRDSTDGSTSGSADDAAGRFDRAKDFVGDQYSAASDRVKQGYSAVKDKVGEVDFDGITDQLRGYVRSNPGKALLFSVAAGFVIGLLLRRDEHDDDE